MTESNQVYWRQLAAAAGVSSGLDDSDQEIVARTLNITPPNAYSVQEMIAGYNNINPSSKNSVQELLFAALQTELSLVGPPSRYSEAELLELAVDNSISISDVLVI